MASENKITFTETCPNCGSTVPAGNFCAVCRCRLHDKCDCWVLGREYDCGCMDCPGEGLYLMLLKRGQHLVESKARVAVRDALSLIPDGLGKQKFMDKINSQLNEKENTAFNEAVPKQILSGELESRPLSEMAPMLKYKNFNHSKVVDEVLKVMLAQHPTIEDVEIVFAIARYKLTDKLILTTETFLK